MTLEQVQNDLRVTLDHFVGLGNVLKSSYTLLYPSEKGVMIYGLLVAGRRLASLVREAEKWQKQFILNVTGLDLVKTRRDLLGVMGYLKQCDCDVEISMLRENAEPLFDSERIVDAENYRMMFPPKENDSDYIRARKLMIDESPKHFEELSGIINEIDNRIYNLQKDDESVRRNKDIRIDRLREMNRYYHKTLWKQAKELLVNRVRGELRDKENRGKTEIEILQSLLNYIVTENTVGNRKTELAYINQRRGDDHKLAAAIVDKRDKLTLDDVMQHFEFVASERFLTQSIDAKKLREPCDEYDGKLFVNKAAMDFTTLVWHSLRLKVDFSRKINFALFYLALSDCNIVYANERNVTLMAQFIKETYDCEVSPDSISKIAQKCLGKKFCIFDDNNHGKFTDKEFAKYKDAYWACFTIIRGVSLINIEYCAEYLKKAYRNYSLTDMYEGMEDWQMDKAYFAGFVLRGGNLGI